MDSDLDGLLWENAINSDLNIGEIKFKKYDGKSPIEGQLNITEWAKSRSVYIAGRGWGICLDNRIPEIMVSNDSYLERQIKLWKLELPIESQLQPAQGLITHGLYVSASLIILIFSIMIVTKGFKYGILFVTQSYATYDEYDKEAYRQSLNTIHCFSTYKPFQRSMKWWIWRNRKQYAPEINNFLSGIANSPYRDDPHYQKEVIQLIPTRKKLNQLLKEDKLEQLVQRIERLNQTYWAVDF